MSASQAYLDAAALDENKPIELYELHLKNGVVWNFASHDANVAKGQSIAFVDNMVGDQNYGASPYGDPRSLQASHFHGDIPQLRTTGQRPLRLRVASSGLIDGREYGGGWGTSMNNGDVFLSRSNDPFSFKVSTLNDKLFRKSTFVAVNGNGYDYFDGWGIADPNVQIKAGANPTYHVLSAGIGNWFNHFPAKCLIYSHGLPGDVWEHVSLYKPGGCGGALDEYGYGPFALASPFLLQYYDKEGIEEAGEFVPEWADQDGEYSYACMWSHGYDWPYSGSIIWWNGKNGLKSTIEPIVVIDLESVCGATTSDWHSGAQWDGQLNTRWRAAGFCDPFCYREKGSSLVHFFCASRANYIEGNTATYGGICYKTYDISTGVWSSYIPTLIIRNPHFADKLQKPNIYYDPATRLYILTAFNNRYGQAMNQVWYNPDITDMDGWIAPSNLPLKSQFAESAYLYSNLMGCYADATYDDSTDQWYAFPIKRDAIKVSSDDQVNVCSIYFSNVNHHFTKLLANFDIRLSRVVIRRTFQTLDPNVVGNAPIIFEGIIDDVQLDVSWCKVTAKESLLQWDMTFPRRAYSMCCGFRFKSGACGYLGDANFCDKTFETCTGYGNEVHFGGFSDVAVNQWKHRNKQADNKYKATSTFSILQGL